MEASTLCQFLEWDTEFFGFRIARVLSNTLSIETANAIDVWASKNKIDCVYFLARSDDAVTVSVAEDFHYRQQDIRVQLDLRLQDYVYQPQVSAPYQKDLASEDDISNMLPIIENTFIHSRFYNDPHFPRDKCEELYNIWLERSIVDKFADQVIVFRRDNLPLGFITCKLNHDDKIGSIGLVGVAHSARGQHLGTMLVNAACNFFSQEGMLTAEVVTQGRNIVAQRLYQKCGFRTASVSIWYHKWFDR